MSSPYLPFAAYAGALALTLVLACYLTPARWWRRPTARGLAILGLGTWGIGSLLLHAASAPAAAPAPAPARIAQAAKPLPPASFRVHRDLNLRQAPGTQSPRLGVVPAGSLVTPTGVRQGDWWQVRAAVAGREQTGWASSLWLRRQAE